MSDHFVIINNQISLSFFHTGVDFDFYKEEDDDPFAEAKQNALEASVMMWAQGNYLHFKTVVEEGVWGMVGGGHRQ